MIEIPSKAQIVIVGGGIVGCSVAYHLSLRGVTDVVLLERKQLTSGTTWHAAGLVGQLRATHNLTRLAQYTTELYASLERTTGQATGFRQIGSLALASTEARFEELKRGASMARCFGLEVDVLTVEQAWKLWPLMATDDLVGAVYLPKDGQTNPVDTTQALAKAARSRGVRIVENVKVEEIVVEGGKAVGVRTALGDIRADIVVNAAGMWARDLGAAAGTTVPLHAAEHFYIVTEPIPGLPRHLPVLRDADSCAYFKEDAGKLLVGWFEPVAKPWGMKGIPESFCFDTLPDDLAHIEPLLETAMRRVPALAKAGIQLFFNGPESFTPDDRYLLGETPEVRGLFVAAGFNSIGIQSAGGAGKVLADWIVDGHPPMDLWDVDIRRMMPFQRNRLYLRDRTVEALGLLYAMHWPFRQPETARGVRRSALHDRLLAAGACFGETAGWERPNWYAPKDVPARYDYSYGRQNWFEHSAAEHRAVRSNVGLFDQSSFGKYLLQGPDAEAVLNRISANDVAVPVGRIVYTQWLNERGGIEADLTVTREAEDRFLIVTAAATQTRDLAWLQRHIPADARAVAVDVTSAHSVLSVMGPQSRLLLAGLTGADLSNAAFPFGTSQVIDLGYARVRASRITYVGELGWELYIPTEFTLDVFDRLAAAGQPLGLRLAGYHALNSLRLEKAYRHWGHDITEEDTPLEAGLGFAVAWNKPGGFIGRAALLKQKERGVTRRLVHFALDDPSRLLYHNEPIWRDGTLVGRTSSGMFGHTIGKPLAMGYIDNGGERVDADFVNAGRYEIEIAGERIGATATLQPFYDPANRRVKDLG
ncbi:4-methylaminobutanoate oxidase (formaldehyde-forming) [Enhydrobacter aerosaccus]|uniref:4-methylaminobutanoate oxidase (Formaldehyde-forming) n=1 Tax=Enhydrobacter aerosaccus TaxID=225324 RepID=A0A1T4LN67_9HYPH|nr:FAD-dependent oxidoreductase [Enhydrobacter aerosaccus]SJZ56155.1 4-methylaminobutanoate oxidase (formaldehyde-forming) [Enhydrobacter aerosaccus]